jgi:hypothetical protein
MNINGIFHVNVNCSNYEKSREFYALLGYKVMWEVPEEGSPEVSAAVGMPPYTVRGALLALEGAPNAPLIDLLEWRDPKDPAPPYPHLYHLGIARLLRVSRSGRRRQNPERLRGPLRLGTRAPIASGCGKFAFRLFQGSRWNHLGTGADRSEVKFDPVVRQETARRYRHR